MQCDNSNYEGVPKVSGLVR